MSVVFFSNRRIKILPLDNKMTLKLENQQKFFAIFDPCPIQNEHYERLVKELLLYILDYRLLSSHSRYSI